jgi:hypothetical protein
MPAVIVYIRETGSYTIEKQYQIPNMVGTYYVSISLLEHPEIV